MHDVLSFDRFWSKVDASGDCWEWIAGKYKNGYGQFSFGHRKTHAHRVVVELLVGDIPDGMEVDHLCRNRGCVNPDHLEVVTRRENQLRGWSASGRNARKTECPQGHPYDAENTHMHRDGSRRCRACDRERHREAA